jgi:hypothetical protein
MDMSERLWWAADIKEEDRHAAVLSYVRGLEDDQRARFDKLRKNAWLYDRSTLMGTGGAFVNAPTDRPVVENVIQSIVDTSTALICRSRPRVSIQTERARFSIQKQAADLERVIEGQFQLTEIYRKAPIMVRDGEVFGLGGMKHYIDQGEIKFTRALADEMVVDLEECRSGEPRQMHQRRFVDRGMLKARYPKFAKQIDQANTGDRQMWTSFRRVPRTQCAVVQSWHLPSAKGADDGMESLCIDGATLFQKPWTKPRFPFIWWRWAEGITGFYGRGLCEELAGAQLRLNELNDFIRVAQDLVAVPTVLMNIADAQIRQKMDSKMARIWAYRVAPPQFVTPPAVSPELYAEKERIKAWMYQQSGVSEMAAHATKEPGIEAAAALRELADNQSGRLAIQVQTYEQCYIEFGRAIIEHMKELGGRAETTWNDHNLVRTIRWEDVDPEENAYSMSLEPASIMSHTPAGRTQAAIDLAQAGLITPQEARHLTGHPDIQETLSLEDAAAQNIARTIEKLEDGKPIVPEPWQDLKQGMPMVQYAALRAQDDDAPEEILENFRTWLSLAKNMLEPPPDQTGAAPPGPQGQASPPGPAPGGAMPPPNGVNATTPAAALAPTAMQVTPQ